MEKENSIDVSSLYLCEVNRWSINQEIRKISKKTGSNGVMAIVIAMMIWVTPLICIGIGAGTSKVEKNTSAEAYPITTTESTTSESTHATTPVTKTGKKIVKAAVSITPFETTNITTESTSAVTTNIIETTVEETVAEPVIQLEPLVVQYEEPQIMAEPEHYDNPPVIEQEFETSIPETEETIELPETDPASSEPVIESIESSVWYDENNKPVSEDEFILLCNIVGHEYGSDYVSVEEKAKVVDVVMTRVREGWADGTIYGVLAQPYQFTGFYPSYEYAWNVTPSCKEAVYYYFNHVHEFASNLYFYGSGGWNHFYR